MMSETLVWSRAARSSRSRFEIGVKTDRLDRAGRGTAGRASAAAAREDLLDVVAAFGFIGELVHICVRRGPRVGLSGHPGFISLRVVDVDTAAASAWHG
jgi:hypothetical protein